MLNEELIKSIVDQLGYSEFFIITFAMFSILYFSFSAFGYLFISRQKTFKKVQNKSFRSGQIMTEVKRSFVSILMFSILSLWMCYGLKSGIYKFNYSFKFEEYLIEVIALFLWNELYFFIVHKTFHLKIFYKYHVDHHFSFVPSPFSAYSFHWSEGLLLGAVMPIAMLFNDFEFWSIMTLPVMSIVLNALGHSNLDFFPHKGINSLYSFSKRHSLHHQNPHKHFGFFLPWLDMLYDRLFNGKSP